MIVCPHCTHENREGLLVCEHCQRSFDTEQSDSAVTRALEMSANHLTAKATWGTARFGQDARIVIQIRDVPEPVVIHPARQTILGRLDRTNLQKPDLDLTPYGALEKGVSRIHAAIKRSEHTLTLIDMSSANGTHLNGQRLIPEQPRVLRDGDEIRLGNLVAHIFFK